MILLTIWDLCTIFLDMKILLSVREEIWFRLFVKLLKLLFTFKVFLRRFDPPINISVCIFLSSPSYPFLVYGLFDINLFLDIWLLLFLELELLFNFEIWVLLLVSTLKFVRIWILSLCLFSFIYKILLDELLFLIDCSLYFVFNLVGLSCLSFEFILDFISVIKLLKFDLFDTC